MSSPLRLMCVFAHPDDESMGAGGTLAKYAAEGVETSLVTATRGQCGWAGDPVQMPSPQVLGAIREAELRQAAAILGLRDVTILDYMDGELDKAEPLEVIGHIVRSIRRARPQVIITFGPDGSYGHPDHIAICQFTTAACQCAVDASFVPEAGPPHRVDKLYYMAESPALVDLVKQWIGDYAFMVDGVVRKMRAWDEWMISASLDTSEYWRTVWRAVSCHRSQLNDEFNKLGEQSDDVQQLFWGRQTYYRAFSLVNGGRKVETDLFEGIRERIQA
jgi:LmbE family N-acetylglucosaminyl deacetylase